MATTDDMIMCQTIGHAWFPADAMRRPKWGNLVTLRCERCDCVREDLLQFSNGSLLSRAYNHPDGYREAGFGFDTKDDKRFWLAKRELEARRINADADEPPVKAKRTRKRAS